MSPHQHAVKVVASAASLNEALTNALEGLTNPKGHHAQLEFHSFEVNKIGGRFDSNGAPVVQVTVEAFGAHKA